MARTRRRRTSTTVLLVRHGQTPSTGAVLPGRARGLHLSDVGVGQAQAVARRIAACSGVAAVYTSPIERARETAGPIAAELGTKPQVRRNLTECDFGAWTGRELKELRRQPSWETVQRYPSGFRFPDGESFTEMQSRIWAEIGELVGLHPGETVVAVSHADPIKGLLAQALGTHLDLFQRIVVSPCSVSGVLFDAAGPTVLGVNSVGDDLTSWVPS